MSEKLCQSVIWIKNWPVLPTGQLWEKHHRSRLLFYFEKNDKAWRSRERGGCVRLHPFITHRKEALSENCSFSVPYLHILCFAKTTKQNLLAFIADRVTKSQNETKRRVCLLAHGLKSGNHVQTTKRAPVQSLTILTFGQTAGRPLWSNRAQIMCSFVMSNAKCVAS